MHPRQPKYLVNSIFSLKPTRIFAIIHFMNIRQARKDEIEKLQKLNEEVFIDNQKYDSDLRMDWSMSDLGKKFLRNFFPILKDVVWLLKKKAVWLVI